MFNILNLTAVENLPDLTSIQTDYGRLYKAPTSNLWYPSVTTVTGFAKKDFFTEWRKNPENKANMENAAKRGTALHNMLENYLTNNLNADDITDNLFLQIKPAVDFIDNIHCLEKSMWSNVLRLAGRTDCIAEYKKELAIIDFKTSNKSKRKEWITNYFEQATCYAIMYQELFQIPVNKIVILVSVDNNGGCQIFEESPRNYIPSVNQMLKNYWKSVSFENLQEIGNSFI